ncbi:T9SS type A sorting domain-containing protein [Gracilimonas mengyeensis]|uniref:Por secretion system C-terminal sorting domain-containing protein n=1 Tax=Gracilimonas mengyeensis TaxID=1302730 RepID=A0A521FCQ1_9BACT|nr:T9SS type A sorting domain-containing protein [Gracilimonas mengyeensis]SMO93963.1 Por secretion system C-terminal sorting domain-containing protein [Gracilimonas mengyeensis]
MISYRYKYFRFVGMLLAACFLLTSHALAQDENVLVLDPYNVNQESLADQIFADTLEGSAIPEGRVYELQSGEIYLNDAQIEVRGGSHLHIRATNPSEKAIVYQFPTGTGDDPQNPPGYLARVYDGNLTVEGLAISGYYEPGFSDDETEYDQLYTVQGGLFRNDSEGARFIMKNNTFSNVAGQILRVNSNATLIHSEDNVYANLGALSTSNFGAGKGIDLRESVIDSLILRNNTFVNYQDRPIRHYNWGNPTEGTGDIIYGEIDHNTFVNGMGFHGVLSLGNLGEEMIITNNLFVDAFAAGEDSTDETRSAEWGNVGNTYENGNNKMSWIFGAPDTDVEYMISNNFYAVSDEGQAWLDSHAEITVGQPLSDFIREQLGDDADAAFAMIDAPDMTNIPDLMIGLMDYYVDVADKTKDTPNDVWDPAVHDMDRRPITYYLSDFDASYSTSSPAYSGGEDGFPAGDLNWFPAEKEEWMSGSGEPQEDVLVLDPYNVNQESLADQIFADTLSGSAIPEGRVYELQSGEIYLNDAQIEVRGGSHLHIRATNPDEKAVVYQFPTGAGDDPQNPPGYLARVYDGHLTVEGLAISGYYEPGFSDDESEYEQLYTVQGGLFRNDSEGARFIMKNNIFSNVAGQILRVNSNAALVHSEDNIYANLGALSTSNFGAGKGIDLRESVIDELILRNNTFVNYQDRPIRHYNYGNPTEGTGDIIYGEIDHNTFVNGMGFHGVLSLGNLGDEIIITNNLFVDGFAAGEDSTDETRSAEWGNVGDTYENGNNRMSWIFGAPDTDVEYMVSNNFYAVSDEGQAWLDKHEEITVGQPLSDFIREQLGDDADAAFSMIDAPDMTNIPDLMIGLMDYYVDVAEKTKDTPNDVWDPAVHDMDRRPITYYMNDFDASYSTSSPAYNGGEDGFPAGDLNWFPAEKDDWMTTSTDEVPGNNELPRQITLHQNYPNPFNPTTTISYQLSKTAEVQLEVFDVLGQKVATVVNGARQQAGEYTVRFDATNLSSGMYFYMLKAGDVVQTKKMTLIK